MRGTKRSVVGDSALNPESHYFGFPITVFLPLDLRSRQQARGKRLDPRAASGVGIKFGGSVDDCGLRTEAKNNLEEP